MCFCEKERILKTWKREDNDIISLFERILTCRSYRHVIDILKHHHWVTRQVIYELRTQAMRIRPTRARLNYPTFRREVSHFRFHNPGW